MKETMRIKALSGIAGPDINLRPGDEYEGDPSEMARWCEAGIAEPVQRKRNAGIKRKPKKAIIE